MNEYIKYPEHKLTTRIKLSYKWLPDNIDKLLDGGCSYGYGTRFLKEKAIEVYAVDIDEESINVARKRYPDIFFKQCQIYSTGLDTNFFDAIVLNDILEHTQKETETLDEMFRLLKDKGILIISTPYKGLFQWFDPYNYGFYIRKYFPLLYKVLYKVIRFFKEGKIPKDFNQVHLQKHWHYSHKVFIKMLNSSDFVGNYKIERVFLSGLILDPLALNLESFLNIIFKQNVTRILIKPIKFLANLEYWIPFSILSYNIAIKIRKIIT